MVDACTAESEILPNQVEEFYNVKDLKIIPYKDIPNYFKNKDYKFIKTKDDIKEYTTIQLNYGVFTANLYCFRYLNESTLYYAGYNITCDKKEDLYWYHYGLSLENGKHFDTKAYVYFKTEYAGEVMYLQYVVNAIGDIDFDKETVKYKIDIK